MLLHWAETLNKTVTVPINRDVFLLGLKGPFIGIFIAKTNCLDFFFFLVFICLFLPLVCKLHLAKDYIWLVHCVCRMSCKVPGIRKFSEDVSYL